MPNKRRDNLPFMAFFMGIYFVIWVRGGEAHILLLFNTIVLFFWIFFPKLLDLPSAAFKKAVKIMSFMITFIVVFIIYFVLFILFKPVLFFYDKRFFKKPDKGAETYFEISSNDWKNNIKELF